MKILCWNVAGIRATLKKGNLDFLENKKYDIVCFQETKAEAHQVKIPKNISDVYLFRYWQSTLGTTQRKGLSGTAIWSKQPPIAVIDPPSIDEEGRVTTLEFKQFIICTVYTPNSQRLGSDRNQFRVNVWDNHFKEYICELNKKKPVIVCGDFNVANEDIDLYYPDRNRNVTAGFLDNERANFKQYLGANFIDAFRELNKESNNYTYWDQRRPYLRATNRGWRIDYFLISKTLRENVKKCSILSDIMGSDHCPIDLNITFKQKLIIV